LQQEIRDSNRKLAASVGELDAANKSAEALKTNLESSETQNVHLQSELRAKVRDVEVLESRNAQLEAWMTEQVATKESKLAEKDVMLSATHANITTLRQQLQESVQNGLELQAALRKANDGLESSRAQLDIAKSTKARLVAEIREHSVSLAEAQSKILEGKFANENLIASVHDLTSKLTARNLEAAKHSEQLKVI
jgi:chromosome segregation ATPase